MPAVLITGANRGLGLEFVRQYAEKGAAIIACCRNPEKADQLKALAAAHKNIRIEALDVTSEKSVKALAAKLGDAAIDILINNAGVFSGGKGGDDGTQMFGSIDAEAWDRVLRINVIAPVMLSQALAANIARSKERKLVVITSKMGSISDMGGGYVAYRSSKAAVNAAMVSVANDLRDKKIAVLCLHPGWVQTDMGTSLGPAPLDPATSIRGMIEVIGGLSLKDSGRFIGYDGKAIAW